MGIKKELGKKIKKIRIERGYTQEKLSEMINISQRALSSIEIGENFVSAETLDNLLSVLEITSEDLFSTNNFKEPEELIKLIYQNINLISNNSEKLEIIYNLTKSLIR